MSSFVWPDRFFPFFFGVVEKRKTEKGGLAVLDYIMLTVLLTVLNRSKQRSDSKTNFSCNSLREQL